ncbi:MAG: sigma-54-dependent Fis family transcriptional regulator [Lentisphaerae bacterium]|nr:sigma-54-dependent Fis family transcriptional regulator [Lentisphaerota bacterium]
MKHILVVDDERGTRESLKAVFSDRYILSEAENAAEGLRKLSEQKVDLLLLDVVMPEKDGLTLLREARELYPGLPVIMISGTTSARPVVEAMRVGAQDFVTKPFDVEELRHIVRRAIENTTLHRKLETLESEVANEFPVAEIVGESTSFLRALDDAGKAAETDATVLIQGESGTGKELVARLVHTMSSRRDEPFVAVHCAALSEQLMESELFGHEKGAFTGADKQKPGRFDLAGSGTIFFDEVSEMTLSTQVKMLRVLQEREFMRVGGTKVIRTDARIVAATAKNLRTQAEAGEFRDDLYYRLSVVPLVLPPLRERTGDIELLARYFLDWFNRTLDVQTREFSAEAMDMIEAYAWPGNVRELRNIVERMLVLHGSESQILPQFLPEEFSEGQSAGTARHNLEGTLEQKVSGYERELIAEALEQTNGVQTRAAEVLGTTRRILKYRMEKLGIGVPKH